MDLRAYKFISSISRFFFSTDQKFIILFLFNHLIYYCASLCLFFVQRKIFVCRCCCLMLETAFTALTLLLLVHLSSRNRHRNVGIRTCISTCGRLFFFHAPSMSFERLFTFSCDFIGCFCWKNLNYFFSLSEITDLAIQELWISLWNFVKWKCTVIRRSLQDTKK